MLSYPNTINEIDTSDPALINKTFSILRAYTVNFAVEVERKVMTRGELLASACDFYHGLLQYATAARFIGDDARADQYERAASWWLAQVFNQ